MSNVVTILDINGRYEVITELGITNDTCIKW